MTRSIRLGLCLATVLACFAGRLALADPRIDYMLHCQGCHGPDGRGAVGAAPSFVGQVGKFLAVPGGREYLVRVPGTSRSELGDAATATLLNWLVREFSPEQVPGDFSPYTEAEVAAIRRPAFTDPGKERQVLLERLAERDRPAPTAP